MNLTEPLPCSHTCKGIDIAFESVAHDRRLVEMFRAPRPAFLAFPQLREGAAHHRGSDDFAALNEPRQLIRREAFETRPEPDIGSIGTWAWRPTRCSISSNAGLVVRVSRCWRSSNARFSCRWVRTSAVPFER